MQKSFFWALFCLVRSLLLAIYLCKVERKGEEVEDEAEMSVSYLLDPKTQGPVLSSGCPGKVL